MDEGTHDLNCSIRAPFHLKLHYICSETLKQRPARIKTQDMFPVTSPTNHWRPSRSLFRCTRSNLTRAANYLRGARGHKDTQINKPSSGVELRVQCLNTEAVERGVVVDGRDDFENGETDDGLLAR